MFSPVEGEVFWLHFLVFFFDSGYFWVLCVKLRGTLRSMGTLFLAFMKLRALGYHALHLTMAIQKQLGGVAVPHEPRVQCRRQAGDGGSKC